MRSKFVPARRSLVASLALSALCLSAVACGSDDVPQTYTNSDTGSATDTSVAAGAGAAEPPVPSAQQLDAKIKGALDKGLPDDQRLALIEDGEAFRSSIPDLYKALSDNPHAKYMVVDPVFDNHDGTLTATFKLDKDGSGSSIRTATVHFVAVDGEWKIDRNDLCGILRTANYHTPACG